MTEKTKHESALENAKKYKHKTIEGINWNRIPNLIDKLTWNKLISQFWMPERVPVADDLPDWRNLSQEEKTLFNKVFGGLTLLDTLQGEEGVLTFADASKTKHERAVYTNIEFMEQIHAQSYSTIFSTFCSPSEIDEIFEWIQDNKYLQYKANKISYVYNHLPMIYRKIACVLLESFLFYSGFYTPLRYLGESKMIKTAEIIQLIIRDESVHGTFVGTKFRQEFTELSTKEQQELTQWTYEFAMDLYQNELGYTKELYASIGWADSVNTFLEYNLNKALDNLGLSPLFSTTSADVDPLVMNGLSTTTGNHDFFSTVGNGYLMGNVEVVTKTDYELIDSLAQQ